VGDGRMVNEDELFRHIIHYTLFIMPLLFSISQASRKRRKKNIHILKNAQGESAK